MKKIKRVTIIILLYMFITGFGIFDSDAPPKDVIEINDSIRGQFTVETFPYYFPESQKLIDYYSKVVDGKVDSYCYLELDKKNRFKYTIKNSDYYYCGKIKNNYPEGKGVVFKKIDNSDLYGLYAIADFDKGYINGYALRYTMFQNNYGIIQIGLVDEYEGEYLKGTKKGNGVTYMGGGITVDDEEEASEINANLYYSELGEIEILDGVPMDEECVIYIGEHDGDINGEGTLYNLFTGKPRFIGELEHALYKKGKLYNDDGTLLYEGEFKRGRYHGKGTLYNEDGSVKYKGKFKNGDIK